MQQYTKITLSGESNFKHTTKSPNEFGLKASIEKPMVLWQWAIVLKAKVAKTWKEAQK